jgi:predicted nuclease of predicted toxin-antitoxin system
VASLGLQAAADEVVMEAARQDARILVSADTDFGALLAASHASSPSMVLVRRIAGRRVDDLAGLLLANLPEVEEDLMAGSVVVIGEDSLRVRRLPIA